MIIMISIIIIMLIMIKYNSNDVSKTFIMMIVSSSINIDNEVIEVTDQFAVMVIGMIMIMLNAERRAIHQLLLDFRNFILQSMFHIFHINSRFSYYFFVIARGPKGEIINVNTGIQALQRIWFLLLHLNPFCYSLYESRKKQEVIYKEILQSLSFIS